MDTLFSNRRHCDLIPVVGPRADLDHADLLIKREVPDVDVARGTEHTARLPVHVTGVLDE